MESIHIYANQTRVHCWPADTCYVRTVHLFSSFSLSFECPTDIVNFISRAHSSETNRFRARCLYLSLRSPFLDPFCLSFLPCLFCFTLTGVLGGTILTALSVQNNRGIPRSKQVEIFWTVLCTLIILSNMHRYLNNLIILWHSVLFVNEKFYSECSVFNGKLIYILFPLWCKKKGLLQNLSKYP